MILRAFIVTSDEPIDYFIGVDKIFYLKGFDED